METDRIKIETPEIVLLAKKLNKFLPLRDQLQFTMVDVYEVEGDESVLQEVIENK